MFLGVAGLVEEVLEFVDCGGCFKKAIAAKRKIKKFDRSSKSVLEFKAQLIAAKSGRQRKLRWLCDPVH